MTTLYAAALQRQVTDQDGAQALLAALDLIAHSQALAELEALSVALEASGVIVRQAA